MAGAFQQTIGKAVRIGGAGLHSGRRSIVVIEPAPPGTGRVARCNGKTVSLDWRNWFPSRLSTSIALGERRSLRTIEHLMAALSALCIDNVVVDVEGSEIPIFDGSAARWCRLLRRCGIVRQCAERAVFRVSRTLQAVGGGGFLRIEPAEGFSIDVTSDVVAGMPPMRWRGPVDAATFERELAPARSFGCLGSRRDRAADAPLVAFPGGWPHRFDDVCDRTIRLPPRQLASAADSPVLLGWRPWRTTVVVGQRILPWARFPDEPVRHAALDMIGDLALAGVSLAAKVTAHNPSHEKTFTLVMALMSEHASGEMAAKERSPPAIAVGA